MCGIVGFITPHSETFDELDARVNGMSDCLVHRGPDASASWVDASSGVALGHRRLAIIDLSAGGSQPMQSHSGRFVISFNGEIYNFKALRQRLIAEGTSFSGGSDTEVLLSAIENWGLKKALKQLVGMFAFALWDKQERVLFLARDRMGEKPLYYGWLGRIFLFASELKALRIYPGWKGEINRDALTLFFRHNCIPAPYSIYRDIFKLSPGCFIRIRPGEGPAVACKPVEYWSTQQVVINGSQSLFDGSDEDVTDELERLLRTTIADKMVADVSLGAFLSGGVDSSTVVAIMQSQSLTPVKTFTIGVFDRGFNEAEQAKAIALHLGTEHTELYVTPEQVQEVIPLLPTLYDEPFADSSQLPTYLVSKLARRNVTVSLSGDGGDELFGGYNRHYWGRALWQRMQGVPPILRRIVAAGITAVPTTTWDQLFEMMLPMLPKSLHQRMPGDKLHKLAALLASITQEHIYLSLASHWKCPTEIVLGATEPVSRVTAPRSWMEELGYSEQMMYLDMVSYLPDDILTKVDRASMGVSLEARVPFLDHRIVEFSSRVPISMKIRNGQGKWILRQLLGRYLPEELYDAPKMGFGVPIGPWLRGPLRAWGEDLLSETCLRQQGYLNVSKVRQCWTSFIEGKGNWQYHLWDVLMFQAWMKSTQG